MADEKKTVHKKTTEMQVKMLVKEFVSKNGKPFSTLSVVINGRDIQLGFVSAEMELALIKAGAIKIN